MQQVLSREIIEALHFDSSHAHKAFRFEGWQYKVEVTLQQSVARQAPVPASVTIKSLKDDKKLSHTIVPGRDDRRRFAEFIFLLAAKLKCDLLCGIPYDAAGFLHSKEIKRLNEAGLTKVQPTVYAAMGYLYRESGKPASPENFFIRKFFTNRDQLWHLMCFCGVTGSTSDSQNLVWWLNVHHKDVSFRDISGIPLSGNTLTKMLAKLFPKRCLCKAAELHSFKERLELGPRAVVQGVRGGTYAEAEQKEHAGVAEALLSTEHVCSWQDLYLASLIQDSEIEDFIDLEISSLSERRDEARTPIKSQPKSKPGYNATGLVDILDRDKKVAVLGLSGSGKSTAMKWLAANLARQWKRREQTSHFPVLVQLKHFGDEGNIRINDTFHKSISETISILSTPKLNRWGSVKEERSPVSSKKRSRAEILADVSREIGAWLDTDDSLSKVALLLDGLNDVSPAHEYDLYRELQSVLRRCDASVVATKRVTPYLRELGFQSWQGLKPLNEKQMIWFLQQKLVKKAGELICRLSSHHPGLFQLIRRPFFLKIFRELLDTVGAAEIPNTEARLIQAFVERSAHRKLESREAGRTFVPPAKFNYYLAMLAETLISQVASGKGAYVRYPAGLTGLKGDPKSWEDVLHLGESFGILRSSGLHFEWARGREHIAFEHDLFRDYFGALWLMEVGPCGDVAQQLDSYMEFTIWDTPLRMYFELAEQSDEDLGVCPSNVFQEQFFIAL